MDGTRRGEGKQERDRLSGNEKTNRLAMHSCMNKGINEYARNKKNKHIFFYSKITDP